jgi:hypothetical protein
MQVTLSLRRLHRQQRNNVLQKQSAPSNGEGFISERFIDCWVTCRD